MGGALGVEILIGPAAEHQGQDDLGEQHRLQVRLGHDRFGQPRLELDCARLGDDIALAIGSPARLGLPGHHLAVPREPAQGRVHLPERQRLAPAEVGVVVTFQLVAMARLAFEQAQQGQWYAHGTTINSEYTLSQYTERIWRQRDGEWMAWPAARPGQGGQPGRAHPCRVRPGRSRWATMTPTHASG